jgi:predicted RNA-binding Zn-ribbon protein involved in translation (DUF1610 family)
MIKVEVKAETNLDGQTVSFECPNCHHQITETVGRLRKEGYNCPSCAQMLDPTRKPAVTGIKHGMSVSKPTVVSKMEVSASPFLQKKKRKL